MGKNNKKKDKLVYLKINKDGSTVSKYKSGLVLIKVGRVNINGRN